MDIQPIKTEADYEAALKKVESLFDAAPGTPEGDCLEILTTLVEAYEEKNYSISFPDPIEAIKYHLESRGLSSKELEPFIGGVDEVSDILNRKRPLTIDMIRQLHTGLGISADILIQTYSTMKTAA